MRKLFPAIAILLGALDAHAQTPAAAPTPPPAPTASVAPTDFRATPPPARPGSKFVPPAVREARLSNGIRLIVVERHDLPLVAVKITSDIGEAEGADGVPLLAGDVATSATHAHFSWELAHEFQAIGCSYDANASLDGTRIDLHFLAPHLDRALELGAEVATDANFTDDITNVTRVAQRDARHSAGRWPAITLANDLFPETHPFHDLGWGTDNGLATAQPNALDAFWKRAFVANHITLVVVGDVKMDDVVAVAAKHFERIAASKEGTPPPAPAVAPSPRKSILVVDQPNVAQAHVAVGTIATDRHSPDYLRLLLLANILSARVYEGTRGAHGYTYGMQTHLEGHRGSGILLVQGAIEIGNAGQSVRAVFANASNLFASPPSEDEVARAKSRVQSSWSSAFETNTDTAAVLSSFAQLAIPLTEIENRNHELLAVTSQDLLATAKTYLDPKNLHVVVVGNAHDLTAELAPLSLGPVEVRQAPPHLK
jgi:predicted Zn-dependent peptidase